MTGIKDLAEVRQAHTIPRGLAAAFRGMFFEHLDLRPFGGWKRPQMVINAWYKEKNHLKHPETNKHQTCVLIFVVSLFGSQHCCHKLSRLIKQTTLVFLARSF